MSADNLEESGIVHAEDAASAAQERLDALRNACFECGGEIVGGSCAFCESRRRAVPVARPVAFIPSPALAHVRTRDPDPRPLRALMETQTCGRVYGALAAARDKAEAVLKASTARVKSDRGEFTYQYASADHIAAVARDALHGTGLVVVPMDWRMRKSEVGQFVVLDRVMRIAHSSGEFYDVELLDWPILPGSGGRDHAKALGVALTSSLGYFERNLLLLPCLDSDDMNAESQRPQRRRDRGEPQDTTPAPAVADELSARGRVVLAKLDEVRDAQTLGLRLDWWNRELDLEENGDGEAAPVRRYTDADVRAISARLDELLVAMPDNGPVDEPAPDPVDEPAPAEPVAKIDPQPAPARTSPSGAKVPTPNAPAASRPAGARRTRGGGLPGME